MSLEGLTGAKGLRVAGKSAQNIAEYEAAVAEQEAEAIRQKTAFDQKRQALLAAERESSLIADVAHAGGLGSPVVGDLAAKLKAELELENLIIGYEGEVGAKRAESQAIIDRFRGELAKQRGKSAASAANIRFGTQLATTPFGSKGGSLLTGFA